MMWHVIEQLVLFTSIFSKFNPNSLDVRLFLKRLCMNINIKTKVEIGVGFSFEVWFTRPQSYMQPRCFNSL